MVFSKDEENQLATSQSGLSVDEGDTRSRAVKKICIRPQWGSMHFQRTILR